MLPQKIREAAERAEQIHRQVYGGNTGSEPTPAPVVDAAPIDAPQEPAVQEPAPVDPSPVPTVNWEEKYKVLDGKYRAEVPRMAQEIRGLKDANEELRAAIAQATAAP